MLPYQQRVVDEQQENEKRLVNLRSFLRSSPTGISSDDLADLVTQEKIMSNYDEILKLRISKFNLSD